MSRIVHPIAIIGGGSAGIMAVNRALLNNDSCLLFTGGKKEKRKSRALWVRKVENIPAHLNYKKGITEPNEEMLQWLKQSVFSKNLTQINKSIIQLQWKEQDQCFELIDEDQSVYFCQYVVLCTGIMDVQPKIAGSIQPILPYANTQQVDYCLRCDGHHVIAHHAGVIGHTNAAAWVAIILHEKYSPTTMSILNNGEVATFGDEELKLLEKYNIAVFKPEIAKIKQSENKKLVGFELVDKTSIEMEICFVALGVIVYNKLALQLGAGVDDRGYVLTDDSGQSSVDKLYIAGDLRAGKKKQIYTAWDTAVDALDQINARIRKEKRLKT